MFTDLMEMEQLHRHTMDMLNCDRKAKKKAEGLDYAKKMKKLLLCNIKKYGVSKIMLYDIEKVCNLYERLVL